MADVREVDLERFDEPEFVDRLTTYLYDELDMGGASTRGTEKLLDYIRGELTT